MDSYVRIQKLKITLCIDDDNTTQNPSIERKEAAAKPEEKEQEHHSTQVTEVEEPTDNFSGEKKQETEPEDELLSGTV